MNARSVLNPTIPTMVKRIRGRALQERNARIFKAEPLCRICRTKGRITEAVEVDHIIALCNGGTEQVHNLQPVCEECNDLKAIAEQGQHAKDHELKGLDWIA
jgi:5-methylcytosine-specific restriction protein A